MIGHPLKGLSALGYACAMNDQTDKALDCLEKIKLREQNDPNTLLYMEYAFVYSGLKEFDKAFAYLNKSYENRLGIALPWNDLLHQIFYVERIKNGSNI